MKNMSYKGLVKSLLLGLLFIACSDDEDSGSVNVPSSGKVDITLESSKTTFSGYLVYSNYTTANLASVTGINQTGNGLLSVSVTLYALNGEELTTGDYPMYVEQASAGNAVNKFAIVAVAEDQSTVWFSTEGKVTITKLEDDILQGTISGKAAVSSGGVTDMENLKTLSGGFNVAPLAGL
ncbi:hypothetical protein EP331_11850 [bacterium]|nr:MAG: hypothetical protein EP331_11850 [bacterium]